MRRRRPPRRADEKGQHAGAKGMIVERVVDVGQWFERGIRVGYFPDERDVRTRTLEKAALGAYEVVGCDRATADGRRWLDVRLRRFDLR
jgi:hypothetical protein